MKTLDEVIKALEYCTGFDFVRCQDCPGYSEPDCGVQNDALHYLKEYQRYQKTPSRNGHMALVDYFDESQKNEPLSWDELRTMEGKPVWVEGSHGPALSYKGWALISFDKQGDDMKCQLYNSAEFWIGEEDYGTDWQAYRKER